MKQFLESASERVIFAARWLLAPVYLGLIGGLAVVLVKFFQELWHLAMRVGSSDQHDVVLAVLSMLDLALLGNLILIVIFAGYENFVSKIGAAENSEDRPHWMGHVDFSGLKIKLIGSLVAISVIELLQDFVHSSGDEKITDGEIWRVVIHLTFVLSGVMFAVMDYIGDKRTIMNGQHALALREAEKKDPKTSHAVDVATGP